MFFQIRMNMRYECDVSVRNLNYKNYKNYNKGSSGCNGPLKNGLFPLLSFPKTPQPHVGNYWSKENVNLSQSEFESICVQEKESQGSSGCWKRFIGNTRCWVCEIKGTSGGWGSIKRKKRN